MAVSELTDEEIVIRLQELRRDNGPGEDREEVYFNELYNRYGRQVYCFIRYYGMKHEDANDVLQDGFIKLYHNIHRFTPGKPFKTYFLKMILNLVRDKYRHMKLHRTGNIDMLDDRYLRDPKNFDEFLHKKSLLDSIIGEMPEEYRELIQMKLQTDSSLESIAEKLGISRRMAYYRYKEAIEILKKKMAGVL